MADDNYLASWLRDQGYIGSTASTPYKAPTQLQLALLQQLYGQSFAGQTVQPPSSGAIHLSINFDGTQNNKEFVAEGEKPTNVAKLYDLLGAGSANNRYYPGIGAQTPDNGGPSLLDSTPDAAGSIGNQKVAEAYSDLVRRVGQILQDNPNAQIELNLTGFSRGSAQAIAFANLVNEKGIPGLYDPGQVPINSMVLYDPVSQTRGVLDPTWPGNVRNTLVLVAMDEGRQVFPAMPVGANAIVIGVPGAHSDVGGTSALWSR